MDQQHGNLPSWNVSQRGVLCNVKMFINIICVSFGVFVFREYLTVIAREICLFFPALINGIRILFIQISTSGFQSQVDASRWMHTWALLLGDACLHLFGVEVLLVFVKADED